MEIKPPGSEEVALIKHILITVSLVIIAVLGAVVYL